MVIPIPILINPYVKRDDIPNYFERKRKARGFVLIALALVCVVVYLLVYPKVVQLYTELGLGYQLPNYSSNLSYFLIITTLISIIGGMYFLLDKPNQSVIDTYMHKYKDGEMIHIRNLKEKNDALINISIFIYLLIVVSGLLYSLVSPIYYLTSQF